MFNGIIYSLKKLLKKPFKVGIVSYYYPEKFNLDNGVAIHTYYLSRELAKLGCEVHIFCKGNKQSIKNEYLEQGKIIVHRIGVVSKLSIQDNVLKKRISYFMFDNQVISEITKENKDETFDIIHTHGWLTSGAFVAKYFNDIKWIHTFHALEKNRVRFMSEEEKKYFEIVKWMESTIKNADALIAVSKNLKEEVLQNYPVEEEKIHYIPNGVDLELFKQDTNCQQDKVVLYVGRFSLEKGIDIVFKIADKLLKKNKEAKFTMVASDKNIPKSLEKLSRKFSELLKKYPDRFTWYRETLNRIELSKLYNDSLIYIQPSRYESFGLCILEAMACGKAVIASNKGGIPDVVENAGIIIPLNKNLFINNILKLLEDYRLRERYIRRALERSKSFSWNSVASQIFELYQNIKKGKTENKP
ncbi:MAG: glycosyltransferase family 4 protein [Nanoarchaeota archaeon]|nr:glycosyltransferase family 4 protein [Nanoarchaeota archaeon]